MEDGDGDDDDEEGGDDDDEEGGDDDGSLWKVMDLEKGGFVRGGRKVGVLRKRERGILVVTNRKEDEEIELVAMVEDSCSY